jgi:hypothetical protein
MVIGKFTSGHWLSMLRIGDSLFSGCDLIAWRTLMTDSPVSSALQISKHRDTFQHFSA